MAPTRSASAYQLHVELHGLTLTDLVEKVAQRALLALPPHEREQYLNAARREVEAVLREHIVAFDTCGLSAICGDSEPYDPWPPAGQDGAARG